MKLLDRARALFESKTDLILHHFLLDSTLYVRISSTSQRTSRYSLHASSVHCDRTIPYLYHLHGWIPYPQPVTASETTRGEQETASR